MAVSLTKLCHPMAYKNLIRLNSFIRRLVVTRMVNFRFPSVLGIEPTNACDLHCKFCPREKSSKKIGFMNIDLFKHIIDESLRYGRRYMIILHKDGEPLLHPKLARMVSYAKKRRAAAAVQFATNGYALDAGKAKELIDAGLDGMTISIDAARPETFNRIKGRSVLARIEENMRAFMKLRQKLRRRSPYLIAKMVITEDNYSEMTEFRRKWKSIADEVAFMPYVTWQGDGGNKECIWSPERWPCNYLWYYPSINWDGRVSVCCVDYDCQGVIGDINKENLYSIWQGGTLSGFRKAHINRDLKKAPFCASCTYWAEGRDNITAVLVKRTRAWESKWRE